MKNLLVYIFWPIVAGLMFAGGVLLGTGNLFPLNQSPSPENIENPQAMSNMGNFEFTFRDAAEKSLPAIVTINNSIEFESAGYNASRISEQDEASIEKTQGTGILISPDGYIITNLHVFEILNEGVPGEPSWSATLYDGRTIPLEPVAKDENKDLVLLKFEGGSYGENNFPYLEQGNPRVLSIGDFVLAIGNPRNLGQSVSLGIISSLHKMEDSFIIQTDAAINPGNSGGALLDYEGNLIGITSRIISESGGFEGISFAIPAMEGFNMLENYLSENTIPYLGVQTGDLVKVASQISVRSALPVLKVSIESPAEEAGIQAGDMILAVNDIAVDGNTDGRNILNAIARMSPGDQIEIDLVRGQTFMTITAVLGESRPFMEY